MMTSEEKVPILLDTDIGSDIDDAVCLAYLLRQPRCELLGVTTATGEPEKRAALAKLLCRTAGRDDIPVHSGCAKPMLVPQQQPFAPQAEILGKYNQAIDCPPNTAVEFLRRTIRERPGEITLLTIEPLTNIGLLFAVDPEIPYMLKSLVMMCGVFTSCIPGLPHREWNAMGDPHASAIVYNAPVASHTSIGLDVTMQCRMDAAMCRQRFTGELLSVVADMAEVWFRSVPVMTFHDPLAAVSIFDPEVCAYQTGTVSVELNSPYVPGMTIWSPNSGTHPHRVAVSVDPERFFEQYFSVFQ